MPPKIKDKIPPGEMKLISKIIPHLKVKDEKKKNLEKIFDKKK